MPQREVDPDTAAALDLVAATADALGEAPGPLLRRLVGGLLAAEPQVAGSIVEQSEAPHATPQDAAQPWPVSLLCRERLVHGLYDPALGRLIVVSGTKPLDGVTYSSPTSAARAVISVLDPQASPTAEYDGGRLWHTTIDGQPLVVAQERYWMQQAAARRRGRRRRPRS